MINYMKLPKNKKNISIDQREPNINNLYQKEVTKVQVRI